MAGKLTGVELRRAHLVPSSVFASPEAVLREAGLSPHEMARILRRWEFDLRRHTQPPAPEQSLMLDRVRDALAQLGPSSILEAGAQPTRH
jgi:hypothetical protein